MPDPMTKIECFIQQVETSDSKHKDLRILLQHLKKTYQKVETSTTAVWITK
jgi:hypothetical protein